jgi:hypothetical protein
MFCNEDTQLLYPFLQLTSEQLYQELNNSNDIFSTVPIGPKNNKFFVVDNSSNSTRQQHQQIFILCAEIMAIKIRENPKIKGIKVLHSEHEISQFADDTSVILVF